VLWQQAALATPTDYRGDSMQTPLDACPVLLIKSFHSVNNKLNTFLGEHGWLGGGSVLLYFRDSQRGILQMLSDGSK